MNTLQARKIQARKDYLFKRLNELHGRDGELVRSMHTPEHETLKQEGIAIEEELDRLIGNINITQTFTRSVRI